MKHVLTWVLAVVVAAGLSFIATGAAFEDAGLLSAGTATVTVSVAALAATFGVQTWADERRRVTAERQREAYVALARDTMSRFLAPGEYSLATLAGIRADISCWGDPKVVEALADWNEAASEHINSNDAPAGTPVFLDQRSGQAMADATARLVSAIRRAALGDKAGLLSTDVIRQALTDKPSGTI